MSQRTPSTPPACLSEYGLDRHLLGLESAEERERSLAHIAGCDACHQDMLAWREAADAPAPLPAMPPSLWDRALLWWSQAYGPGLALGAVATVALVAVFAWQRSLPTTPASDPSDLTPSVPGVQRHAPLPRPAWRIKGSDKPVLLIQRTRKGKRTRLTGSGVFHQGDEVRIYYKWLAGRYIFLLHRDATGKLTPLYPSRQSRSMPLHQGGMQSLPDAFAVTDPASGDEEIWACFSRRAIPWDKIKQTLPPRPTPRGKGKGKAAPAKHHLPRTPRAQATRHCLWRRFVMKRKAP